jgi:hypothetical protein
MESMATHKPARERLSVINHGASKRSLGVQSTVENSIQKYRAPKIEIPEIGINRRIT